MAGYYRKIGVSIIVLAALAFLWKESAAAKNEEMETVYYYVVQPGDSLWKISRELYGEGSRWERLYYNNQQIFDPARIYPGEELKIPAYAVPEQMDERFQEKERKQINSGWLREGYVHFNSAAGKRSEYPEKTEADALNALKEGTEEEWLKELASPVLLTEEEKEEYRERDPENILYSYETVRGLPQDKWYLLTGSSGTQWLVIENLERGDSQEFYRFRMGSETGDIWDCEKFHGAGGRLYLAEENSVLVWVMTKEEKGKITGIAGDYTGEIYVGGNFYYEKRKNGTVKESYQEYATEGSGTIRAEGAAWGYPW